MAPVMLRGPVTSDSFFETQAWSQQFTALLTQGVLYPRWLPASFAGLGAPVFYFYPPLPFYGVAAVTLMTGGRLSAFHDVVGAAWAFLALSGWTMRLWLRRLGASPHFALAYIAAPYHLLDFALRGDLAEFAALSVLPLVMLGVDDVARGGRGGRLSLAYAVLIATHLPMALIASVLLVAPSLLLRPAAVRRRTVLWGAVALLLGVALAAVYLAPALTLQGSVAMDKMRAGVFRPEHWYVWRFGALTTVGRLFLILAGMWLAAAALARNRWAALAGLGALCVLGLPPLLSAPLLDRVQFPWRALGTVEFAAVSALSLAPGRVAAVVALATSGLALAVTLSLRPDGARQAAESAALRSFAEAPEYAPAGALPNVPAGNVLDTRAYVAGLGQRFPEARADHMTGLAPGEHLFLKFAFPAWTVACNGAEVASYPSPGDRLLAFHGAGDCRATLRPLPAERWGLAASLLAALAIGALAVVRRAPAAAITQPVAHV